MFTGLRGKGALPALFALLAVSVSLVACAQEPPEALRIAPTSSVKVASDQACEALEARVLQLAPIGDITIVAVSIDRPEAVSVPAREGSIEPSCTDVRDSAPGGTVQALFSSAQGPRVVAIEPGSTGASARIVS